MTVRPEQTSDERGIYAVHAAAFPTGLEARLVDALRTSKRLTVSLVAELDAEIVGHIAFSPVSLQERRDGLGLAPFSVLPSRQRQGIGGELIRAGLQSATRAGAGFVVVLGDPAYYSRFGFAPASRWGLSDEYGGGEAFQAIEIQPGAIHANGGLVRYAPEFSIFGEQH
jgi:putative acetyltransferase